MCVEFVVLEEAKFKKAGELFSAVVRSLIGLGKTAV